MKKSYLFTLIACALCVAFLFGVLGFVGNKTSMKTAFAKTEKVRVTVAHLSDIHIITEENCNFESAKFRSKDATEAKYLAESTASLRQTFIDMLGTDGETDVANYDAPLYVLISGDLTLNGEYSGHVYLSDLFGKITAKMRAREGYENFQILVIPGNHDIYNPAAATYTPTQEKLDNCATQEEKVALMSNYKADARMTSSTEFMELYKDFGYGGENMAANIELEFFYKSEYWYDDVKDLEVADDVAFADDPRLALAYPTKEEDALCSELGRAYFAYNRAVRHGACSYIARTPDITFVSIDGNSRKYVGDDKQLGKSGVSATEDWKETTGGEISDMQFRWIETSLKTDVEQEKLIISQLHQNVVPHFDMEDEVLSLFTFDDYRRAINVLPDAGIKYAFTGHMHASDLATDISQNGNVIYDFETGSAIAYGNAYRLTEFITEGAGETYVEDVKSIVKKVDKTFTYHSAALGEDGKLYMKEGQTTEYTSDHFEKKLREMIPTMAKNIVTDGIFLDLKESLGKSLGTNWKFLADLAGEFLTGLNDFEVYPLLIDDKGLPYLDDKVKANYTLVDFVDDLVDWFCDYDFSNGQVKGGYKVGQIMMDVYGVHLAGTNPSDINGNVGLNIFISKMQDGSFVKNLVKYLCDLVLPQLDLVLNAPIRFQTESAPILKNGFDITKPLNTGYDIKNGIIKGVIKEYSFEYYYYDDTEEVGSTTYFYDETTGYSSLKQMLNGLLLNVDDILDSMKTIIAPYKTTIDKYYGKVKSYANKYFAADSLYDFVDDALVSKYVTDAFCKNLGDYVYRILTSLAVDDTPDGLRLIDGEIVSDPLKLVYFYNDGKSVAYGGHAYSKEKIYVEPTVENGLLPANITISDVVTDGIIDPTKKHITWRTKIDVDLFSKNEKGEYEYAVPDSYITVMKSGDVVAEQKANGVNLNIEYPSIDLGILYFNMSYLYETYNIYDITLTDLQPDTVYHYLLSSEYGGTDGYFKTAKASGDGYTIMAMTDIQGSVEKNYVDSYPNLKLGVDTVGNPDFIISAGDNVDNGKNSSLWGWMLNDQSGVWANNTFVGAAGNHERHYGELSGNLALPNQATGKEYYSFFYINTQYIVLDTNDLEDNALSSTQFEWLTSELKKAKGDEKVKWIIVVMHKGLYTAGSHAFDDDVIALRKQLTSVFAEYGVNVVLQGHDHTYTVSEYLNGEAKKASVSTDSRGAVTTDGVLYINMGTLGDKFYDYLYSDAIKDVFVKRSSVASELKSYLNDGYLELTETPVFLSLNVTDKDLKITSYGVVDGKAVVVDDIVLTNSSVENEQPKATLSAGAIAGIAVGASVAAAGIAIAIIFALKKKKA